MSANTQGAQAAPSPAANPFRTLWDLGYARLVPVIPPQAGISERSSLAARLRAGQDARGKVPGVKGDDGLWRGIQFVAMEAQEQDLDAWNAMGASVGIKTGQGLIAVDIDTRDKDAAQTIHGIAMRTLGPAPIRFGNHPKCLLLYEGPGNATYKKVSFSTDTEEKAAVELLTEGRQFVAHGTHPGTGKPYVWQKGTPRRQDLTEITAEMIGAFLQGVADTLPGARVQNSADDRETPDQESLQAPDWDTLKRAVEAMPNTQAMFPTRNDYVRVAYAIKGAAPDGYEHEARDLYLDWCARWDGGENDIDVALADWHRAKPPYRTGFNFISNHAPGLYFEAQEMQSPEPVDETDEMFVEQRPKVLFPLLSISDVFRLPKPRFLIDRHFPQQGTGVLFGEPGGGKSFVALDMSLHIAYGLKDYHGDTIMRRDTDTPPRVLYIAGEGVSGFQTRIRAWQTAHAEKIAGLPEPTGFRLVPRAANFLKPQDVENLYSAIVGFAETWDLIVVDTVSRSIAGQDENKQEVMSTFVDVSTRLSEKLQSFVLGIHHPSKAGEMRGSTVFEGGSDSIFRLKREKGASIGRLSCYKQKDGIDGWSDAYRFDLTLAGVDGETSLVPVRVSAGSEGETVTPDMQDVLVRAVGEAAARGEHWSVDVRAGERFGPRIAVAKFGMQAETAQAVIDFLIAEGRIAVEIVDKRSKKKGLVAVDNSAETDIFD